MPGRPRGRQRAAATIVSRLQRDDDGGRRWRYPYAPFEKQTLAHEFDYVEELLFGGSRGPGKTEFLLPEVLKVLLRFPGSAGAIFRRSFPDLSRPGGVIPRLLQRLAGSKIADYNATAHSWTFTNGSVLELAHLSTVSDVQKYLGAEYQVLGFDQVEQLEREWYVLLLSCLRSSGTLAELMDADGYRPRCVCTANPGGPGHMWVKERWIDPAPALQPFIPDATEEEPEPLSRVFIPALPGDNPALDDSYRQRLRNMPPDLRKAWEEGDWNVMAGARFGHFRSGWHVRPHAELAPLIRLGGTPKALGIDYGWDQPFVGLWGAQVGERVLVYREVDGAGVAPADQARLLLAAETPGERSYGRSIPAALDPATWAVVYPDQLVTQAKDPFPNMPPPGSIARSYWDAGLPVRKAHNERLAGVAVVADLLTVRHAHDPDLECLPEAPLTPACGPRLVISDACPHLIATLPAVQRDPKRPEDVLKSDRDHWYDALRYLLFLLDELVGGFEPSQPAEHDSGTFRHPDDGPARPAGPAGFTGDLLSPDAW